jgi:threonine synthase
MEYTLKCTQCAQEYPPDSAIFRCRLCKAVLEVNYDYSTLSLGKGFKDEKPTHQKYAEFFPIETPLRTLGEGGTELKRFDAGKFVGDSSASLYLKIETENPTRTFKDRGTSIDITKAMELGFREVCCASTGNMGLSVARYSKHYGLGCTIFISRDANAEKLKKIEEQGAKLEKVNGDFNDSLVLAEKFAKEKGIFLCGDYHYRKEGQKSLIFEVLDQLKHEVPDFVFVQVGNATLLAAVYKGLTEYTKAGLIKKMPRLVAVQSELCNPLVRAYRNKSKVAYMKPRTYADAIAVGYPTFGFEGIRAIDATEGMAIDVPDLDIEIAREVLMSKTGLKSEPAGATGLAGFMDTYKKDPETFKDKTVVAIITGNNEHKAVLGTT